METSEADAIRKEIAEIKGWLSNRPSASMDPNIEYVLSRQQRLYELKSILRSDRTTRPDTHMMDAQRGSKED